MVDSVDSFEVPAIETGMYEHYKGKQYEVIGVALHSETLQPVVVYKPLYETKATLWVRPYDMFVSMVTVEGKEMQRFRKI